MVRRLATAAPPRPSVVLARHRTAILDLARAHKADRVRVFGSVARGEDTCGSDLDVLVRLLPGADLFDLAELVDDLQTLTGVRVDVVSEGGLKAGSPLETEAVPV